LNEKSVADMSRAKALKGLFRMVTPYLTMKDIPMVVVNHTYMEIGMFPKAIVSGGTGIYYSADNIWIIGRQQDKVGTEIQGYHFIINVEKSRYVREKSKIPVSVSYDGGIQKYSGLLDIALQTGHVMKPSNGWYQLVDKETGEMIGGKVREKDTQSGAFWKDLMKDQGFHKAVSEMFTIGHRSMMEDADTDIIDVPEELADDE